MKGQHLKIGQQAMYNLHTGWKREIVTGTVTEIHPEEKHFFKIKVPKIGKIDLWLSTNDSHLMLINNDQTH